MGKRLKEKLNRYLVMTACIHFFISFFTDRLIFTYSLWNFTDSTAAIKTIFAWGSKAVFLCFLIGFWHFLFWFFKKADRSFVKFTCIYFVLMCVLLFLVWPGIWRMDEFGILFEAGKVFPVFWQHYLTSVFYIIALMLLPVPSGVVVLQNACISLIVGWILYRFQKLFLGYKDFKFIYFGYIPFLFLPVLDSNLYPMRMSLYAYLELLLLAEFVFHFKEKKMSSKNAITLAILSAVIINWRTEAIYYLLALPVCFLVLFWNIGDRKVKSRFIIWTVAISLVLAVPQKLGENQKQFYKNSHEYELTSMLLPVVPLIGHIYMDALLSSYYPEAEEAALSVLEDKNAPVIFKQTCRLYLMDRVLDVYKAAKAAAEGRTGISLYWSDKEFVRNYTDEQYAVFKKIYWQLVLENPEIFMKERLQTFLQSEDLLENTTELFTKENVPNYEKFKELPMTAPVSNQVRNRLISILELRDFGDYQKKLPGYSLVYSALPAMVLELFILLALLWKRKWGYSLLLASHMAKIPLIFLTAPSRLFMYYYPVYLTGYVLTVFLLLYLYAGKKGIKGGRKKQQKREVVTAGGTTAETVGNDSGGSGL